MQIPATCPNCGLTFASCFEFYGTITSRGNIETCPRCGAGAFVWEGVFQALGNIFQILQLSDISQDHLRKFLHQAELAASRQIDLTSFENRSRAIDPRLGQAATEIKRSGPYVGFILGLLIYILSSCDLNIDAQIDINRFIDQYIENQNNDSTTIDPSKYSQDSKRQNGRSSAETSSRGADPEAPGIPHPKPPRD